VSFLGVTNDSSLCFDYVPGLFDESPTAVALCVAELEGKAEFDAL
jgi:hypothetical protein